MDRHEKARAVSEAVEMVKFAIMRPDSKFQKMLKRKVKEAIRRALWDKTLELRSVIEKLDEQDEP